jgi:hypothetical protein
LILLFRLQKCSKSPVIPSHVKTSALNSDSAIHVLNSASLGSVIFAGILGETGAPLFIRNLATLPLRSYAAGKRRQDAKVVDAFHDGISSTVV